MRSFAMTYPQLMNQAMQAGIDKEGLAQLRNAHQIAERLVAGLYRAAGVPFLCHLVRTASIVLAEGQPIDVVVASILHAAYILSYFDRSSRRRPRLSDRNFLRDRVGPDVEQLISEYARLPWHGAAIARHLEELPQATERKRHILIMRLANELEDHLDLAMAYTPKENNAHRFDCNASVCVELATSLGRDELAADLARVFDGCAASKIPDEVIRQECQGYEIASPLWTASIPELWFARAIRLAQSVRRRLGQMHKSA